MRASALRRTEITALVLVAFSAIACEACKRKPPPPPPTVNTRVPAIAIPDGPPGIGFDDLRFSPSLNRLLVPAARTGTLALVDPGGKSIVLIPGFSATKEYTGAHDFGVTSADEGSGLLFVTDRTAKKLSVIDPATGQVVAATPLGASPDYVRFSIATREIWVTEPDREQIEIFSLPPAGKPPQPALVGQIKVAGGPESLVFDRPRGRAYTHLWRGASLSIDVKTRAIVGQWPNGCEGSRGIALDEPRGFLFAACDEGKTVVLDVGHAGVQLSNIATGAAVDVIDYSPSLEHLYIPSGAAGSLAILSVTGGGKLGFLGVIATAPGAHCVTADAHGNAFVCDQDRAQLLVVHDPYPASAH